MRRLLSVIAIGMVAVSASAGAQAKPQLRDGLTISLGLGGGSQGVTCTGCATERETGSSMYLSIGGAHSPSLVLSGELNAWGKKIGQVDYSAGSLLAVAQWYPAPATGFFVKGGAGLGVYQEKDPTGTLDAAGLGYLMGAGYDIRVARNFSLTPFVNYTGMANSDVKVDARAAGFKMGSNYAQYGLGFTWH